MRDRSVGPEPLSPLARRGLVASVLLLALALALRCIGLGTPPLWHDEAYTWLTASLPLAEIPPRLERCSAPPLYFLLLHFWIPVAGESEAGLRLLSVLMSVALVAMLYVTGKHLLSGEIGLFAALFAAVSPIQIYFSQQVRMYSLMPLGGLLAVYGLVRLLETGRRRHAVLAWLGTSICLYAHTFGLLLLPALALLIWAARPWVVRWQVLAAWSAAVALTWLPWLPSFLVQLRNQGPFGWFHSYFADIGVAGSLIWTLCSFAPGGAQPPIVVGLGSSAFGGELPALLCAVLALLGGTQLARGRYPVRSDHAATRLRRWFAPIYFLAPSTAALAASVLVTPIYAAGRTDQLIFPAFCLLVAAGISVLPKWWKLASVGVIMLCAAVALPGYYSQDYRLTERQWSATLAGTLRPNEPVVCTNLTRTSTAYYLHRAGRSARLISYPREAAEHLGYFEERSLLKRPEYLRDEAAAILTELREQCGPGGRFFVLVAVEPSTGEPLEINQTLVDLLVQTPDLAMEGKPLPFGQFGMGYSIFLLTFRFSAEPTAP